MTSSRRHWEPATVIRQVDRDWRGDVTTIRPVTVVGHDDERLLLYTHAGAPFLSRAMPARYELPVHDRIAYFAAAKDDSPLQRRTGNWHVLTINPRHGHHSVWVFWRPDWQFHGWYVNFQRPWRRYEGSIEVVDWFLDIFVSPDGSWSWKDVDEFDAASHAGLLTPYERRTARAEARKLVRELSCARDHSPSPGPSGAPSPGGLCRLSDVPSAETA